MVQSQFSLCWDSYKSSICNGFSALQQNGEFVDMTLAADGHFVKVHQVLIALASPYLKDLISSAPCQHPVIFLNNVSNRTLCLLLEYIYTGEVLVRADNLAAFAEAARALHIKGLENISSNDSIKPPVEVPIVDDNNIKCTTPLGKRVIVSSTEPTEQIGIPGRVKRVYLKQDTTAPTVKSASVLSIVPKDEEHEYTEMFDDSSAAEDNESFGQDTSNMETERLVAKGSTTSNLQFTVSIRGSLQMILNRYIYNLNSKTTCTGVRRWRCVDYRNKKCTAFVITRGNIVLKRANPHNHSFHDKKILAKMEKKAVFSALDEIEGYKEKEHRTELTSEDPDMSIEHDHFTIDDFESEMDVKPTTLMDKIS